MTGGAGDDLYVVDGPGDQVHEASGGGNDTVFTTVNYALAAGEEIETLWTKNSGGLTLTANEFDNFLIGGSGDDTLTGGPGNDKLSGGAGADTFRYSPGDGSDIFTDFNGASGDKVDLLGGVTLQSRSDNVATLSNGETLTARPSYFWAASDFQTFP
jgi:serralysin